MRATRWWWGMLCVAGMACGDEGPMGARTVREVGRDLEFVLPAVREEVRLLRDAPATSSAMDLAEAPTDGVAMTEGSTAPFILSTHASLRFEGKKLHYAYGMTGWGSGYTMSPTLSVIADDGGKVEANVGSGRSEDLFYPWRFTPTVSGVAPLARDCGMYGDLIVLFEARLVGKILTTTREQTSRRAYAKAPSCPTGDGSGGAGGGDGSVTKITVCTWEVWTDLDGQVIETFSLGCTSYTVPLAA